MFRKLLATTAVAALLTGAAIAQQQPAPAEPAPAAPAETAPATPAPADQAAAPVAKADGQLASNVIGEAVYNSSADDAQKIGDVNDLVLDANGSVKSLIVGVGGFLGVGEKNVEIDYKTADWTEKNGDRWIVIASTKEQLETQPAFDPAPYEPVAPMPTAATPTTTDPAPATPPAAPAEQPKPAN